MNLSGVIVSFCVTAAVSTAFGPMAQAAVPHESRLMAVSDVPGTLGKAATNISPVAIEVPATKGLQLCVGTNPASSVAIGGPSTFTKVLIATDVRRLASVSELVYQYPTEVAAVNAWKKLRLAAKKCAGTVKVTTPEGSHKATLTQGYLPGVTEYVQLWINHADVYASRSTKAVIADDQFSVFTQAGNAILVTQATNVSNKGYTPAQRASVGALAQQLSDRWVTTTS